jgi:hypothetical protein
MKDLTHSGRPYRPWSIFVQIHHLNLLLPVAPDAWKEEVAREVLARIQLDFKGKGVDYPDRDREKDLAALAAHLPGELLREIEAADTAGSVPLYRPEALLPDALALARQTENVRWLFAAALRMPLQTLPDALSAAREIGGDCLQAELMGSLADAFARLPPTTLYPLWEGTLHAMASLGRREFLVNLGALAPVLARLAGPGSSARIVQVVRQIRSWWP